jgi:SAM-dependent methyltransferase
MSVSTHLGIAIDQYDQRIRTFIPRYAEMIDAAAAAVEPRARTIVDLGIGTGALASRCLRTAPQAHLIGLDADAEMLALAGRRLGGRVTLICGNFLRAPLPSADAVVASLALHHIRTRGAKRRFYRRVLSTLRPGGVLITADWHPAAHRGLAQAQRQAWHAHLRKSYTTLRTSLLFRSWAREDVYVPLEIEAGLMRQGGFSVEVVWRRDGFVVLLAEKRTRSPQRHRGTEKSKLGG